MLVCQHMDKIFLKQIEEYDGKSYLNIELPLLSMAIKAGKFPTHNFITASGPNSGKAITSAFLIVFEIRAPAPPTAKK